MTATACLLIPRDPDFARWAAAARALDLVPKRLGEPGEVAGLLSGARGTCLLVAAPVGSLSAREMAAWRLRTLDPERAGLVQLSGEGAPDHELQEFYLDNSPIPLAASKQVAFEALRSILARVRADLERAEGWPDPAWALPGPSASMAAARRALGLAAARPDATVWISGPVGVGRAGVARAVHALSSRAAGPFRVLDPGGAGREPSRLLDRVWSEAVGGTLYLAPVEALGGAAARLAGLLERPADQRPRLVVGARAAPDHLVPAGELDGELARRLNVLRIALPPLDERPEDAQETAEAVLAEVIAARAGRSAAREWRCAPGVGDWLRQCEAGERGIWRHWVERALGERPAEGSAGSLGVEDLERVSPRAGTLPTPGRGSDGERLEDLRRRRIEEVLTATGGNKSEAARRLGIHRATLHAQLKRYGLG